MHFADCLNPSLKQAFAMHQGLLNQLLLSTQIIATAAPKLIPMAISIAMLPNAAPMAVPTPTPIAIPIAMYVSLSANISISISILQPDIGLWIIYGFLFRYFNQHRECQQT